MSKKQEACGLPENAYRELKDGEVYKPIVPASSNMKDVTPYSVITGIIMAVVFSGATAFLGLKTGNVFEAAIPIALMAVGLSFICKKATILENVIIQSIGACSGSVVAGAIFTLPAIYIFQAKYPEIKIEFFHIFMASLLGGILGIVLIIFFRKYFVADMHGKFPFPEGTATTEILVSGQQGKDQAKILCVSMGLGAVYDFCIHTLKLWSESFYSTVHPLGQMLSDKFKMFFGINTTAALMGMGYIIGFKYAAIMCAGSFLAWFVLVPLLGQYGSYTDASGALMPMSGLETSAIFKNYVRLIGIGGIACAGIIGIIKSAGVIVQAFGKGFKAIFSGNKTDDEKKPRTEQDMNMGAVMGIIALTAVAVFGFFHSGVLSGRPDALMLALVGLAVVMIIAFLFTTVAARAIATVGSNPVSGMTLMTLIISSLILVKAGLNGAGGIVAALVIGGVVCTALSMAGAFITDLKIGYWIGATPKNQELFKFLGTLVAALSVAGVMMILNNTYGFVATPQHPDPLVAPQANAMAAVIEPIMVSGADIPWMLYIVGIILALVLELIHIPALAFMLGVYIPLELNLPVLAGGIIALLIEKSHKDAEIANARKQKGTLIASGFVAGGAIIGVVDALLKNGKIDLSVCSNGTALAALPSGQWTSIVMYVILAVIFYILAVKVFSDNGEASEQAEKTEEESDEDEPSDDEDSEETEENKNEQTDKSSKPENGGEKTESPEASKKKSRIISKLSKKNKK